MARRSSRRAGAAAPCLDDAASAAAAVAVADTAAAAAAGDDDNIAAAAAVCRSRLDLAAEIGAAVAAAGDSVRACRPSSVHVCYGSWCRSGRRSRHSKTPTTETKPTAVGWQLQLRPRPPRTSRCEWRT